MFRIRIWDHCRYVRNRAAPYDEMARHMEACRAAGVHRINVRMEEVISLDDCCRAAAANGLEIEARIAPDWSNPAPVFHTLPESGWEAMEREHGIRLRQVCMNHPDNRRFFVEAAGKLAAEYAGRLKALHLDFIRNGNALITMGYPCECAGCRDSRRRYFGRETVAREDFRNPAVLYKELEFRNRNVRETVSEIKRLAGRNRMGLTMAARANYLNQPDITDPPVWGLGPAVCEGQDWVDWLACGLVDEVYPMNYHTDSAFFLGTLNDHLRLAGAGRDRLYCGIGLSTSMGELGDEALESHLRAVRDAGLPGAAIFNKTNVYTPAQFAVIRGFADPCGGPRDER